uniref:Phospholipase d3 n=2 Tax=Echinococcus granulosus TaxID=6210 RepID=A0A068X397_ECHGR|nr:phospholipase d3 [Echinococcus granulosus]
MSGQLTGPPVTVKMNISTLVLVFAVVVSISSTFVSPLIAVFAGATSKFAETDLESCTAFLTESLPEGLVYPSSAPSFISTAFAWDMLLYNAQENVSIASFYWSMLREDVYNSSSAYQGENIFQKLLTKSGNINVNIVTSGPRGSDNDLDRLIAAGAKVEYLDVAKMLSAGVQHAKLWAVDNSHGYLGSANMDWRSLTQVKEIGVLLRFCRTLATDLAKIIGAFDYVARSDIDFPINWSPEYTTIYNRSNPMRLMMNGIPAEVYISMSPPPLSPTGREDDLETILHVIDSASSFIYVSVMAFQPLIQSYTGKPHKYWPALVNALVKASMENNVEVRILISEWDHTPPKQRQYMESLRALNGANGARIRIRFFVVPSLTSEQKSIPFARVNHSKYMVTDKTLYIGTSNWSGDYFKFSGGAGLVINGEGDAVGPNKEKPLRRQLEEAFLRDWNSMFTDDL